MILARISTVLGTVSATNDFSSSGEVKIVLKFMKWILFRCCADSYPNFYGNDVFSVISILKDRKQPKIPYSFIELEKDTIYVIIILTILLFCLLQYY